MIQLNKCTSKTLTHSHEQTHILTQVDMSVCCMSSAVLRSFLFYFHCSPVTTALKTNKHCLQVTELYTCPFLLVRNVLHPNLCNVYAHVPSFLLYSYQPFLHLSSLVLHALFEMFTSIPLAMMTDCFYASSSLLKPSLSFLFCLCPHVLK